MQQFFQSFRTLQVFLISQIASARQIWPTFSSPGSDFCTAATKLQPGLGDALNTCCLCGKFKSLFSRNCVSAEFDEETKMQVPSFSNQFSIVCLLFSHRNTSHTCSGWTWLMPFTKVWSASSFLTLWVQSLSCLFPTHHHVAHLHRFPTLLVFSTHHLLFCQAYADSDVDLFTWGTPITTIALFTILVHLGIETKTWVRMEANVKISFVWMLVQVRTFSRTHPKCTYSLDFNSLQMCWNHRVR